MPPSLLEIAEAPAAHIVPRHPMDVVGDGYVISDLGVQAIRLDEAALERARAHVRAVAAERGRTEIAWWTSDLTQPGDLGERLGLEKDETLSALALTGAPSGEPRVEVRRVETLEDFIEAQAIDRLAHGGEPDRDRERAAPVWDRLRELFLLWLALEDGRPVGMGRAARADGAWMLIGGATLPEARNRGVYRSVVHARWRDAGGEPLVVAANGQSAPVLRRLGFDDLGRIQLWVDRFA